MINCVEICRLLLVLVDQSDFLLRSPEVVNVLPAELKESRESERPL